MEPVNPTTLRMCREYAARGHQAQVAEAGDTIIDLTAERAKRFESAVDQYRAAQEIDAPLNIRQQLMDRCVRYSAPRLNQGAP